MLFYDGALLRLLKDTVRDPAFLSLVEEDSGIHKRGKEIELFLRFITYKHIYERIKEGSSTLIDSEPSNITTSKKIMLNNYMFWSNKNIIDYKKDVESVLEAISCIAQFDTSAFRGKSRSSDEISPKVHELFAEALVIAVIENNYTITVDKATFIAEKIKLWSDETLIEPFKYKTTDPETVSKRVMYVLNMIRG